MSKLLKILLLLLFAASAAYSQEDSLTGSLELKFENKPNFDSTKFNVFPKNCRSKKVALVLSGGGARGLAQIGVLDVFEKYGIDIDLIVGTSIGAITGSMYTSGYSPEELRDITKSIDWKSKLTLSNKYEREFLFVDQKKVQDKGFLTFSFDGFKPVLPTSLSSGQQIAELFNLYLLNARYKPRGDFFSLKIPFCAVATDLNKGERVVLKDGNLSESVKASFTFPLLYTPTKVKGKELVDGGLTANIPVDVARQLGADMIITVNSTSPLKNTEELKNPINTADQILSITLAQLNEEQLKNSDIIITPEIFNINSTDFSSVDYLIDKGRLAAENKINEIAGKIDTLESGASPNFNNFLFNGDVKFTGEMIPDSLKKVIRAEQENNFVRYVTIEKRLRDLYKTGYFRNVRANIYSDGSRSKIEYAAENMTRLNGIKAVFNGGRDVRLYDYRFIKTDSINAGSFVLTQLENSKPVSKDVSDAVMPKITAFGNEHISAISNTGQMYGFYENLLGALRDKGYSLIDISKFCINENTGILEIDFTEGTVSEIDIIGNTKTKSSLILSETYVSTDKPVKYSELKESLGGIYGTNLFQQTSLAIRYQKEHPVLDIYLVEKSSRNLYFSFRADNERKLQGYLSLRNENLFGSGTEIGAVIKGGLRDREYKIELLSNKFFGTPLTYNLSGYYKFQNYYDYIEITDENELEFNRQQTGEYRDIRYGGSFKVGTQIEKFGTLYAQVTLENISRSQLQGTISQIDRLNLFKLKLGGKIDTEDKSPFATSGTVLNYNYESSRNSIASSVTYTKFSFDLTHSIPVWHGHVIKPKFIFGFADKTTPDYELFSLGGDNSFYGMVEDQLRGRQILLASLEYRYMLPVQIFFDTYVSMRYDLGRIWENSEDIRFKDLRHGLGLAAMFDTPIGKAGFSVGRTFYFNKGFSKGSFIWGQYTFYFSIGYDI
ncbi:MAG: patatin-like phospholipase family protein [Bacteroidetes bacterium]|nr:patatin-like phospholipase family protein [Bacteroidota bacterium]